MGELSAAEKNAGHEWMENVRHWVDQAGGIMGEGKADRNGSLQGNLAGEKPRFLDEGAKLMDQWVAEQSGKSDHGDPLFEVMAEGGPFHARSTDEICRILRDTGRGHHADWLEKNGGKPRDAA